MVDVSVAPSRQEQKERTREAILNAALDLSRDHGFAQISLRQVAREAGIVPTAFYRHFRSKVDGLVVEMEMQAVKLVEIVHGDRS